MKHLIVFTALPYYEEVIERIYTNYSTSSIVTVDPSSVMSVADKLRTRPFYDDRYWVLLNCSRGIREVKMLSDFVSSDWVTFVYLCPEKGIYNTVRDWLTKEGADFGLFNCYHVSYFAQQGYVRKVFAKVNTDPEARLDRSTVTYITKRVNGYENSLEFLMTTAAGMPGGISKRNMRKLMPVKRFVSTGTFMLNLLMCEDDDLEMKAILRRVITRYKNYHSPLTRSVNEFFKQYDKLYGFYMSGEFNAETLVHWIEKNGQKLDITSEWQAKRWLSLFSKYSYEFITMFRMRYTEYYRCDSYTAFSYLIMFTGELLGKGDQPTDG